MEEIVLNEKLSLNDRIKFFFKSPSVLFRQYIDKPKYAATFLIFIISSAIYSTAYIIGCKDLILTSIEEKMQAAGQPQAIEFAKKMATNPLLSGASAIIGAIIGIFFASLVYYLIAKFDDAKIKYKQMVSIYCLASMASASGLLLKSIYMLIANKPFLTDPMNPTILSIVLSYLDIFNIWQYVLLVIGISTVGRLSKKEGTFIVAACVVISACVSLLMFVFKLKR